MYLVKDAQDWLLEMRVLKKTTLISSLYRHVYMSSANLTIQTKKTKTLLGPSITILCMHAHTYISQTWDQLHLKKKKTFKNVFGINSDLQESCKDSLNMSFTQLLLMLTSCITMAYLSKLRN